MLEKHQLDLYGGIRVEEVKTCLLRGTEGLVLYKDMRDRLFAAPGVWSHLRCPQDRHVWLSPRPVVEDVARTYTVYYTHNSGPELRQPGLFSLKRMVQEAVLCAELGYEAVPGEHPPRLLGRLLGLLPMAKEIAGSSVMWLKAHPNGKLLDVGSGNGAFMAMMQERGWDVSGIEPDPQAATLAKKHLKKDTPVFIGTIESASLPDSYFDAVAAHHVIGHMHDPVGFLREVWRILKLGGKLVVTTPNTPSLGHRAFRDSWRELDPPRHLYLFSPESLRVCVERLGYQVEVLRTTARSAWEIWYSSRLIRRTAGTSGTLPARLRKSAQFESMIFQFVEHLLCLLKCRLGEGIVLIASKVQQ
jgi:SAM-dependent methyltransferase